MMVKKTAAVILVLGLATGLFAQDGKWAELPEGVRLLASGETDVFSFTLAPDSPFMNGNLPRMGKDVARRKGDVWYLAGLCGEQPTTVACPLDFLKDGADYSLTLVCDDGSAETRSVRCRERLSVEMARGGGFVAGVVRKLNGDFCAK